MLLGLDEIDVLEVASEDERIVVVLVGRLVALSARDVEKLLSTAEDIAAIEDDEMASLDTAW